MNDQVFLLPDLGEGLTEAEVVRWLVQEGDTVEIDQPVVEVETAKSLVEVPTPFAGRIAVRHAPEGSVLEVGKPLLTVGAVAPPSPEQTYREEERAGSGNVLIGYGTSSAPAGSGRRRRRSPAAHPPPVASRVPLVVSPLVRRLARDGGLDLRTLTGSGPGGLIVRADVETALAHTAEASPLTVAGETRIPLSGFRKAVSAALTRSRAEIPEATVWVDVDATPLWELRESLRPGPGILAYVARFVVAALKQYPVLNSRLDTERQEIVQYDRIDLGIAVQGSRGLVVPAVADAGSMTTTRLDEEIRKVTASAREGNVSSPAGTFTLNNYGAFNVDGSAAIINHPQVAILGLGRIIDRPWVAGGELCVRKITQMSFVFDHRVCDGGTAAGFMRAVADAIENPAAAIARL
ncbi:dihydrolipoamide acetyltransferase component of pyruvate dehydrogenase complex [Paractinoplanes deccanensis]|uniref:Dihydrolipoamide acetyltransferase component of pyruvate dehydrogenase complex n=1 Tax=Paractinoplanes deccanensis TaxID=113561 RepID=A0ABQ3YBM2_9ACTN|nr:dihydrolipoamide acetyltransferase family protein [Actinoplanes deccanensis]GID77432.1 dihydrolipoamide acetyltransferase component of pyruvate dehydrogenase complex [Actinoplanes deccanensis]